MFKKTINPDMCTSCMKCAAICTNSRVIVPNEDGIPEFRYDNRCIYCGHCLAICPEGAITFTPVLQDAHYADTVEHTSGTSPLSPDIVFDFLCGMRSNRIFTDQPVERTKLETIVDTMMRAPSAGNEQNRNFYIITNPSLLLRFEQALTDHYQKKLKSLQNPISRALLSFFGALRAGRQDMGTLKTSAMPFKQRYSLMQALLQDAAPAADSSFSYLKHAPALILITRGVKDNQMHKSFYRGDASIATTYGLLMASTLGLASCWMGLVEIACSQNAKLLELLSLKPGEHIDSAYVLGYSDLIWHRLPPRGPVEISWMP